MFWRNRLIGVFVVMMAAIASAEDWPCFRGPGRNGVAANSETPLEWSRDKNVKWSAKLPQPGNSSPIVIGQKVFVNCAIDNKGHQRALFCFSRLDGSEIWRKAVQYDPIEPTHATNPYCASTPASDGGKIVVWHGSAGLYCYDMEGRQLWKTDLGAFRQIWGYAASPIIHKGKVFLNCGPGARSFVAACNLEDGKIIWQADVIGADDKLKETGNWIGSWSTGLIQQVDGQDQLIIFQPRGVYAYDLESGKVIWNCMGAGDLAYTDVMVADGMGIALAGYGGAGIGFKLGGKGDVTATNQLWKTTAKPPQRIGSGVIIGKHLYMPNEPGNILCIEVATGKQVWSHQVAGQTFWASLVASGERVYATSQKGTTVVFAADPKGWRELAVNALNDRTNATPAIVENQIFIRCAEAIYCIGK